MRIAFVGLGIMGGPMAANLVKAGHEVKAYNRSKGKEVPGAKAAATPAEAARDADVVWICVADTKAVEQVLFGKDGVEGSLRPGMIVVDSSTILPSASKEFAERIRAKGADLVDAPITGSKIGAEQGTLLFIVGGRAESVEKVKPLFAVMGKKYIHVGEQGLGEAAKIGMNLMIALIFEGFAEGLTLTSKLGVPREKLVELIQASMIRSGVTDYKAPFVLNKDYSPNFPLRLMHKDIHIMLDAAETAGVRLPGLEKVEEVYEASVAEGWKDLDYAATIGVIEKWAGIK
ncbi:MAG: NAD(P)-dependent oxidoreductase [Terriglobia bacterium]|nr:NAD(P)-dependent oxidoreductase [Terriglobia bacterium]